MPVPAQTCLLDARVPPGGPLARTATMAAYPADTVACRGYPKITVLGKTGVRSLWAGGMTAGGFGQMRASDGDRDAAARLLQTAYAEGRVTWEEYDARLHRALYARTYADLDAVTADLPGRYPPVLPAGPARTNALAIAALACGAAQPLTGMLTTIPAIVLGHVARSQIKRTGESGAGLAAWGLALGWAGLAVIVLIIALIGVAIGQFAGHIQPGAG
jgi:hypothetical protein